VNGSFGRVHVCGSEATTARRSGKSPRRLRLTGGPPRHCRPSGGTGPAGGSRADRGDRRRRRRAAGGAGDGQDSSPGLCPRTRPGARRQGARRARDGIRGRASVRGDSRPAAADARAVRRSAAAAATSAGGVPGAGSRAGARRIGGLRRSAWRAVSGRRKPSTRHSRRRLPVGRSGVGADPVLRRAPTARGTRGRRDRGPGRAGRALARRGAADRPADRPVPPRMWRAGGAEWRGAEPTGVCSISAPCTDHFLALRHRGPCRLDRAERPQALRCIGTAHWAHPESASCDPAAALLSGEGLRTADQSSDSTRYRPSSSISRTPSPLPSGGTVRPASPSTAASFVGL